MISLMMRRLNGLLRDDRGSILPMMAALMVALVGMSALAVESLSWYVAKRELQRTADASAVQGAFAYRDTTASSDNDKRTGALKRANAFAVKNGAVGTGVETSMTCTTTSAVESGLTILASCTDGSYLKSQFYQQTVSGSTLNRVRVVASQSYTNILGSMFTDSTAISALGTAGLSTTGTTPCVLGLANSGDSVKVSGGSCITATNCSVQSNGNVQVNGSGSCINASAVYADETISSGSGTITADEQKSGSEVWSVSDPYADNGYFTSSDYTNCTQTGNGNKFSGTGTPATCRSSWKIQNGDIVTLTANTVYYINGDLDMTGGTLTGTNVTIIVKGNIKITGGTVTLSAPTSGTYSGVVLASSQATATPKNTITGGATFNFTGLIYTPSSDLDFRGNSSSSASNCLLIVGNTVDVAGGSKVGSNNCTASGVTETPSAGVVKVSLVN